MKDLLTLSFLIFSLGMQAQPTIILESFASGLSLPIDIVHAGDERLFVIEKGGRIKIINPDGSIKETPFLDIDADVRSTESERGLLGLAFHPDYENNGYFFVNYTDNTGDTQISRFSRDPINPDLADPESEKFIISVDQPFNNHNGGDLAFGPDGYLYIGLGDGGSGGDPGDRSQTPTNLLGKMLRLDIDTDEDTPYAIPEDNPFVDNSSIADEIWSIGLRNPYRYSFDSSTGDLWIADVGQNAREEINFQAADSEGGENYGWRCYEGNRQFNLNGICPNQNTLTFPVHEYNHGGTLCRSVTGGNVYRGTNHPDLIGHYIYADYCTGLISSITPDGNGGWTNTDLLDWNNDQIVGFGEDSSGELYLSAIGQGRIYRVKTAVVSSANEFPGLEEVRLSPNPFQNQFQLQIKSQLKGNFIFSLVNLQGQEVYFREEAFSPQFSASYDFTNIPSGIYFVRIKSGQQVASWKVIKR